MAGNGPEVATKLRRRRLEDRLDPDSLRRLTILTAGPGFGKTTLLSQCFGARPAVWHTVTAADRSLSVLTRNVVRKLRLVVPGLSPDLLAAVEGASGPDMSADSGRPVAIAAALAEDLDGLLKRDVILVLDDIHELGDSGDSAAFLAALCRYVPRRLRVVTASRSPLPFPTSRLSVAGEVDQLISSDLAFTVSEIRQLIELHSVEADPALVEEVASLAGGWPAAVVLAIQAAVKDPTSLRRTLVEQGALFDYLAEEALAGEDPGDIELLRDVALLPWVTSDLLKHLGVGGRVDRLELAAPWMATAPDVPHASAVPPLIGEFLLQHYPPSNRHQRDLLVDAATWYTADGSYVEALDCLRRSGDHSLTVSLLTESGDSMLAAGVTHQIVDTISSLPEDSVTPELLLMDAEVRQVLGDWEGAMERYRVLVPEEGKMSARLAWRLGFLHHMRGDVAAALETYERGELGTDDHAAEAGLLGWHASAYWLRGDRDRAKSLANEALERARTSQDARALATAHTVLAMVAAQEGDRGLNDVHYIKALEHAERGHDVVQTIRIRSNRGSHFLEEGDFSAALAELDIALRLADITGFEMWRAMALANRAQVKWFVGDLEEAVSDLVEARSSFRRIGSRMEAYPLSHLGDVYATRGDTAQARASYEEAVRIAESQQDLQILVPAWSGLVRLIAAREPEKAAELAAEATKVDFGIGRVRALAAAGWARFHAGDVPGSRDLAAEAAGVARVRRDRPGLAEALELQATVADGDEVRDFLDEARSIWNELGVPVGVARVDLQLAELTRGVDGSALAVTAAESLERHGAKGLALQARAAAESMTRRDAGELAIKTLGGFEVLINGEPVPPSAWQSRVAREVVWMLLASRSRPINREIMIDRLWPDEDPSKSSNRLSVALTTIRKVFDPERDHDADHYLQADRDTVALNLKNVAVDVEDFLANAKKGRVLLQQGREVDALSILNAAEASYVGEFLEEQPYAEWAVPLREEARSEYMTVASLLAEAAESEGEYDLAARRYLRMIERDAFNEPAHLGLVKAMERSGRRGTARRLYGNYVTRMGELDVEPEPFPSEDAVRS
jgi:ATP/maltotriose-dependent transcriptional regulator MalT/DNA-binding SARP family transcriptional activator